MKLRVCIPTAGIGSRLGSNVKNINKSLVSVDNRPTISHQIEYFPEDTEFVIPLGYKGESVKNFLKLAYPKKKFFFKKVSDFTSKNSGLGLSILECKRYLNQPFIFLSCDTLIKGSIPNLDSNWVGCAENVKNLTDYRTISHKKNVAININEKGSKRKKILPYIGLCGVKDYDLFWKTMELGGKSSIKIGESFGLNELINLKSVQVHKFNWFDTGNINELERTRSIFRSSKSPNILQKEDESIWFIGNSVIKYSNDKKFIRDRVKRSIEIKEYVPKINNFNDHMYKYNKVEGDVLSEVINLKLFKSFLNHSKKFWHIKKISKKELINFEAICDNFYRKKTLNRINLFYDKFNYIDNNTLINNETVPKLSSLLGNINWNEVKKGIPSRFHGDYHFENIIYNRKNKKFLFLDWRQNFGGLIKYGDLYYDLAKLLHGMIINHEIINKEHYNSSWKDNEINFKFRRKKSLIECEKYFYTWIIKKGFDLKKVKVLTGLIFLNIAALHHDPYCILLYGLGKKIIYDEVGGYNLTY